MDDQRESAANGLDLQVFASKTRMPGQVNAAKPRMGTPRANGRQIEDNWCRAFASPPQVDGAKVGCASKHRYCLKKPVVVTSAFATARPKAAGLLAPRGCVRTLEARGFWGKPAFIYQPDSDTYRCPVGEQLQNRFAREEGGKRIKVYFNQKACSACTSRGRCTAGKEKRIRRWEHKAVLDAMEQRHDAMPDAMSIRRCTVEHVFGTIKGWMGATHFRTRGLKNVATEASLAILAYNINRAIAVAGVGRTLRAITR